MNFEKTEIKRELRPQKLQKIGLSERRPVSRFSAEALQLRTVLSRRRKHQPKLASPVKSLETFSGRNASRLIGAATRILEPGLQRSRAKCALTYLGPGRNMPGFAILSSRDQQERVSEGSSSDATVKIDDVSYCAELILGKRPISRSRIEMHSTRQGSNVKKDVTSVTHVHKLKAKSNISE
ncbi:hypothetical protein HAX54_019056 [Datura stramonium]|uniref:Uncharacterized protein n=1 Tax=Datura stramonium TaxID=4076 RepID=A0ABS8S1U1_DATST|nr:hypothetical protein [Datura stramonium]